MEQKMDEFQIFPSHLQSGHQSAARRLPNPCLRPMPVVNGHLRLTLLADLGDFHQARDPNKEAGSLEMMLTLTIALAKSNSNAP